MRGEEGLPGEVLLENFVPVQVSNSGVARPVKMGGQAVGNAVFQVGKQL